MTKKCPGDYYYRHQITKNRNYKKIEIDFAFLIKFSTRKYYCFIKKQVVVHFTKRFKNIKKVIKNKRKLINKLLKYFHFPHSKNIFSSF